MQIGLIGLGRMGGNIARRLMQHGHQVVVYDRDPKAVKSLAEAGAAGAGGLDELARKLAKPCAIWVMLPAGAPTESTIEALGSLLAAGDLIIDGGNTYYRDDIRRAQALAPARIDYADVGTSGGVWGLDRGYCMMIGGDKAVVTHLDPIFACLAPGIGKIERTPGRQNRDPRAARGYIHCGPNGAGHFVKMVHNGIEYGDMQLIGESYHLLAALAGLDAAGLHDVFARWNKGPLDSYLIEITRDIFGYRDRIVGKAVLVQAAAVRIPQLLVARTVALNRALMAILIVLLFDCH